MPITSYLKNILINAMPLAVFLYGAMQLGPYHTFALNFAIFAYLFMGIISMFFALIRADQVIETEQSLDQMEKTIRLISKAVNRQYLRFNIAEDIIVAGVIAYFGYYIVAAVYIIHIFGYLIFFWNVKTHVMSKYGEPDIWLNVSSNLMKAIDAGETKFFLRDLIYGKRPEVR